MQDENNQPQVVAPDHHQAAPSPDNPQPITRKQDMFEVGMLIFGVIAIIALLTNEGGLLKLAAAVFLGVAIFAIVRNSKQTNKHEKIYIQQSDGTLKPKRRWTPLKILGLVAVLIVLLPVLTYGAFIALFLLLIAFGGGDVGS